jgi:predicted O-methyltransferase YrrM
LFIEMKGLLYGLYARSIYLACSHWSRRWRRFLHRGKGRESRFLQETTLPEITFRKLFKRSFSRIWETEKCNGNVRLSELGILATAAAECPAESRLFEIGTFDGRSTLNLALNSPPDCKVFTLDLPREVETKFAVAKGEKHMIQKAQSGTRYLRYTAPFPLLVSKITQLFGDSANFDFRPYENSCSLVFVDGSHAYEYARFDSATAMKLVRPGGVVLWHDYGVWEGVTRALEELEDFGRFGLINIKGTSLVHWKKPER